MRAVLVLYLWSLRRERGVLAALAGLLFAFEVLIVGAARVLEAGRAFSLLADLIPDFLRHSVGFDLALVLSFRGAVAVGYYHPVVLTALVAAAIVAGRGTIGELEGRTIDLVLSRPVPRWALAARSLALVITVALLLPGAMLAGTATGLALAGRLGSVDFTLHRMLAVNDASLVVAFGAVFVLVSSLSTRSRTYTQTAVGLALVSYLLDYLARIWEPVRTLGPLSLFRHAAPWPVLTGGPVLPGLLVLALVAVAASAFALPAVSRRDF